MKTDFDALLKPISVESPAGEWLRGKEIYRKIEAALEEDLSGSAHGGLLIRARPDECAALAMEALSTQTKDLNIAVWLAEALARIDGFDGLRRALDLIRGLITGFWETVYPLPEDGDEEIRAAPVAKLTGRAFSRVIGQMIPTTRDGYTRLDEEILKSIPTLDKTGSSDDLAKARLEAETKKRVLPESFAASLRATDYGFYEKMSADIVLAREAAARLQQECEARFADPTAVPRLESLAALFDPYVELSAEMMRQKAPPSQAQQTSTPAPAPPPAPQVIREAPVETAVAVVQQPAVEDHMTAAGENSAAPVTADEAAARVFAAARFLRGQNPANPAAFLLPRCWHFGMVVDRGSLDAADLEPPPAELRKELWGLHSKKNWAGLLEKVEEAMELRCATSWLDLHYYCGVALENLGDSYLAPGKMTRALVLEYITLVPGLLGERLLDGTPAASPATARWLESLLSVGEKHQESRTEPLDSATATPQESFDVALRLAQAGRIHEALQVFYAGQQPDDTGRGRFESRLRVARLCIAARQHPLALPLLREAHREIGHWRLEEWDPDLSVRALAMLHECLAASGTVNEEITDVFARICLIDPLLAMKLGDLR